MLAEALIPAVTGLAALTIAAAALLRAWHGWLALKRSELDMNALPHRHEGPAAATRIELADLRERIRRLEAIAAGVDL